VYERAGCFPLPQLAGWSVLLTVRQVRVSLSTGCFSGYSLGLRSPYQSPDPARFENESLFARYKGYHGEVGGRDPDTRETILYD
jgi:hypothetical protein